MTRTPGVPAVILAAGASRRLGEPKQLLRDAHDTAVLAHVVQAALDGGCSPVIVVLGAASDDVRTVVPPGAECVENAEWREGMSSSIRVGVHAVAHVPATGLLLLACDQPAVRASHVRALLEAHARHGQRVVSSYGGVFGIPAVWPRDDWDALTALTGDRGAKGLLRGTEEAVVLPDGARDLDTPADVAAWRLASTERSVSPREP
jgi:molybdenum cofactor cytidylyltransferase